MGALLVLGGVEAARRIRHDLLTHRTGARELAPADRAGRGAAVAARRRVPRSRARRDRVPPLPDRPRVERGRDAGVARGRGPRRPCAAGPGARRTRRPRRPSAEAKAWLAEHARDVTADVNARAGRTTGLAVFVPEPPLPPRPPPGHNRPPMTTVLLADRDGAAFGPLAPRVVPALLPLAGVPLLERALEALVAAGRRSALLVVGPRAGEVERRFGKGIRWGIALEIVRREDGESAGDVLRRLEHRLDGETIVVRGDIGVHAAIGEFLAQGGGRARPGRRGDDRRPARRHVAPPARRPQEEGLPARARRARVDARSGLRGAAARGRARPRRLRRGLPARGRRPRERTHGVLRARARRRRRDARGLDDGRRGSRRPLGRAPRRTRASCRRSAIPPGVTLENAVVSGNLVVDAATGGASLLTDQLPAAAGTHGSGRALGVAALALSLPLWPVAAAWSAIANAGHATGPVTLAGNAPGGGRAPFTTFRFETAVPVLRDLPLLLAVVSGPPRADGRHAAHAGGGSRAHRALGEGPRRGARRPRLARASRGSRRRRPRRSPASSTRSRPVARRRSSAAPSRRSSRPGRGRPRGGGTRTSCGRRSRERALRPRRPRAVRRRGDRAPPAPLGGGGRRGRREGRGRLRGDARSPDVRARRESSGASPRAARGAAGRARRGRSRARPASR